MYREPVDAEALGLPDYHIIVTEPMDLGTVQVRSYTHSHIYILLRPNTMQGLSVSGQTLLKAGQFKDISQMNGKIRLVCASRLRSCLMCTRMLQVWANCMAYNYEESEIWETAHVLSK